MAAPLGEVAVATEWSLARVYEIVSKALQTAEARDLFVKQGHEIGALNPEEYSAFLKAETTKWAQVAKAANLRID